MYQAPGPPIVDLLGTTQGICLIKSLRISSLDQSREWGQQHRYEPLSIWRLEAHSRAILSWSSMRSRTPFWITHIGRQGSSACSALSLVANWKGRSGGPVQEKKLSMVLSQVTARIGGRRNTPICCFLPSFFVSLLAYCNISFHPFFLISYLLFSSFPHIFLSWKFVSPL